MLCVVDTLFGDFMGRGSWHQVRPLARTAVPPYTYSIPFRSEAGTDKHPLAIPWAAVSTVDMVVHIRNHAGLSGCIGKCVTSARTLLGEVVPCPLTTPVRGRLPRQSGGCAVLG